MLSSTLTTPAQRVASLMSHAFGKAFVFCVLVIPLLATCSNTDSYSPLLRAEPEVGSVQTRTPRTLRLYFDALPDVARSNIILSGPAGEYQLRGLHTMAADDLMVEIFEPGLTSGDYTVLWTTVVGSDPMVYSGSFAFSVQTN